MYGFLKYKMGNIEGLMNPKNPKFCQTFQISSWVMSKLHNRCFPIHFLSGIKICKMGTTVAQGFSYVKPAGFYPKFRWQRWEDYRPHLEKKISRFYLTITWPILVHLAWPRARFDHTKEGYKMICSKIHEACGLPMPNHKVWLRWDFRRHCYWTCSDGLCY